MDLRGCSRTPAALARALQIGFALYFCERRLALWRGGRGVRNGFVSADRANARMGSRQTLPGGPRDPIHCLLLSFELHTGDWLWFVFLRNWRAALAWGPGTGTGKW